MTTARPFTRLQLHSRMNDTTEKKTNGSKDCHKMGSQEEIHHRITYISALARYPYFVT